MSDLIKQEVLQKLPQGLRDFASRRVGNKPYKTLNPNDKKKFCLTLITKTHNSVGNMGNNTDILTFQTNELMACLIEKYGELTLLEIEKSFEMMLAGECGPYFGLNKKTYYQALKHYYELPQRSESMRAYLDIVEAPKVAEKPLYIKKQESDQGCINAFNHYKETKQMPYTSFAIYSILKEKGLFNWTHEEKIEMAKEAEAKYVQRLKDDKLSRKINTFQYEELIANLSNNKTLFNLKQEVALKRYFDKLLSEGSELKV